jgi:hypothetical protein
MCGGVLDEISGGEPGCPKDSPHQKKGAYEDLSATGVNSRGLIDSAQKVI